MLPMEKDPRILEHYKEQFKILEKSRSDIAKEIEEKKLFIEKHKPVILKYVELIELFQNMPKIMAERIKNMPS